MKAKHIVGKKVVAVHQRRIHEEGRTPGGWARRKEYV